MSRDQAIMRALEGYETPPEVYMSQDPVLARNLNEPVGVTIRVVHPMGTIAPENDSDSSPSIGIWLLEADDEDEDVSSIAGSIGIDGVFTLVETEAEIWRTRFLSIRVFDCDEIKLERPEGVLPPEIVVHAEAEEGLRMVRIAGHVCDESGAPVRGAGVMLVGRRPLDREYGTRTDSEGQFIMRIPTNGEVYDEQLKQLKIAIVALGYVAIELPVPTKDTSEFDIQLQRAELEGSVRIRFLTSDGIVAAGVRALMQPVGTPLVVPNGMPSSSVTRNEQPSVTRRRLARVLKGQALETQGFAVGASSYPMIDLKANSRGVLYIPMLPPGRYRLRAIQLANPNAHTFSEYGEMKTKASIEQLITVAEPPDATMVTLSFPPGRSVVGRVIVENNPAWHCGHGGHSHFVRAHGWPWSGTVVESGVGTLAGRTVRRTGKFRLDGMPATALTLRVWTVDHGEVAVEVPAGNSGVVTDLGDIRIPDMRVLHCRVVDARLDARALKSLRVETTGWKGAETSLTGGWSFRTALPNPPAQGAAIVVRAGEDAREIARVVWPFELGTRSDPLVVEALEVSTSK